MPPPWQRRCRWRGTVYGGCRNAFCVSEAHCHLYGGTAGTTQPAAPDDAGTVMVPASRQLVSVSWHYGDRRSAKRDRRVSSLAHCAVSWPAERPTGRTADRQSTRLTSTP